MIARLLPLLLALCTLLPAELRAQVLEACRERDDCECRRGTHADTPAEPAPTLRRVDCCEAPCAIDGAASPTASTQRRELADDSTLTARAVPLAVTPEAVATHGAPRLDRAPPRPLRLTTQRWLL